MIMDVETERSNLDQGPRIVFASQRQYELNDGHLLTVGPIGAETGDNYRCLFPTMTVVGRKAITSNATVKVPHQDFHIVKLDLKSPSLLFDFIFAVAGLFKLVGSCDGVIVRAGGLGSLVAIIGFIRRKPVGIEVGGCVFNSLWNYGNFLGKLAAPVSYVLRCGLLKMADRVQMVTQDYLQNRYFVSPKSTKCVGISNVSIDRYEVSILNERRARVLKGRQVILGSIGSFNGTFKAHDQAIKACDYLNKNGYRVKLWIIGAGDKKPLSNLLKSLGLEDKVKLFDPVKPGKEVENWLSDIDIYCQFSRREGISRALIEAMNLGLPVVASNAGGTYELVDIRSLFEIDDVKAATRIIEKLINDNDFYSEMCGYSYQRTLRFEKQSLNSQRREFWADFGIMQNGS
jgi:glycosyltransferase involved in cell wall biosynthesis